MGERGEKKRRSPGQEKARKERQPVWGSPMAQSLKSFKQWCLIWNFIWSLFLFWAVLKVFIPYPQTLTVSGSTLQPDGHGALGNEGGGRVTKLGIEHVGKNTAATRWLGCWGGSPQCTPQRGHCVFPSFNNHFLRMEHGAGMMLNM